MDIFVVSSFLSALRSNMKRRGIAQNPDQKLRNSDSRSARYQAQSCYIWTRKPFRTLIPIRIHGNRGYLPFLCSDHADFTLDWSLSKRNVCVIIQNRRAKPFFFPVRGIEKFASKRRFPFGIYSVYNSHHSGDREVGFISEDKEAMIMENVFSILRQFHNRKTGLTPSMKELGEKKTRIRRLSFFWQVLL